MDTWADVSRWQGEIDWNILSRKVDGAIIKMSEYQADDKYRFNADEAFKRDTRFAVYHFWHDTTPYKDQFKLIKKLNTYKAPVCLDVEGQSCKLVSNKDRTEKLLAICGELRDNGFTPTIYTRKTIWDNKILKQPIWKTYPLWVANYQMQKPLIPRDWKDWSVWQFTNQASGKEFGASSKYIDMNHVKQEWINMYWDTTPPPPVVQPDKIQVSITIDTKVYSGELKRKDS